MKAKLIVCAAVFVITAGFAAAQSTPFAEPPYQPGSPQAASLLGLGDLMALSQMRHAKLWQAGKAKEWALAAYEAGKLRESLLRAAMLYANIPASLVGDADAPLAELGRAASAHDVAAFDRAFRRATETCNACHAAAGIGFVRMRTPTSSPFSNQEMRGE